MRGRRPNGSGTITKVEGRTKPYRVMTPAEYSLEYLNNKGNVKTKRALIGYYRTLKEAEQALSKYCENPFKVINNPTFADVFEMWIQRKANNGKSQTTLTSYKSAFKRCAYISEMQMYKIRLQDILKVYRDNTDASKSTVTNVKIVIDGVFEYAERFEYIGKNYARLVTADDIQYKEVTEEKHKVFTDSDIIKVMNAKRDMITDITLILLYTGFRVSELLTMTVDNVNISGMYLQGGLKTKAGKNRIVPIHPDIQSIISEYYYNADSKLFSITTDDYRAQLQDRFGHLPHDTRHTFITKLKSVQADNVCIERLVGHTSKTITDSVYTHKDIEELRHTISLLPYSDIQARAAM